jgi:hypothetical protein
MATLGQIASLNTSNIQSTTSPTSGIRVVNEKFTRTPGRQYPLVTMVGYGEATKFNAADRKVEWMYERTMKATVTTDAAILSTDTVLFLSDETVHLVGIGQVILNGDEWLRVTSVANSSAGNVTVTRGMWGTTAAAIASGAVLRVGPQVFPANAEFEESPKQYGEWDYNYPMLIQYELTEEMMHNAYTNYLVDSADPLAHHMERLKELALKQLEHWVMYGVRASPASYSEMGAFGGIKSFLTSAASNRSDLPGKLTATGIVDLLEAQYDEMGDLGDQTFITSYKTARIFDAVMMSINATAGEATPARAGVHTFTFDTRYGSVKTMLVPSLKDGEMYSLNFGDMALHPADVGPFGTGWIEFDRGVEILNKRTRQKGYAWAGTFKIGDPKKHALLTFATTDTGSYANYF